MNRAELGEGTNLYAYVHNDPANAVDRLGLRGGGAAAGGWDKEILCAAIAYAAWYVCVYYLKIPRDICDIGLNEGIRQCQENPPPDPPNPNFCIEPSPPPPDPDGPFEGGAGGPMPSGPAAGGGSW